MTISPKTHKKLWGRSGNRCAFRGCGKGLVVDATETDDESIIGQECHIVARKVNGPRGISPLTSEQRDKYGNLILLCSVHHKVIDDQPGKYTVDMLQEMKREHEEWVRTRLQGYDAGRQRDDELYVSLLEGFEKLAGFAHWNGWTSYMLSAGQPGMHKEVYADLRELNRWLLGRAWPKRYPELEAAFENFRRILNDMLSLFDRHAVPFGKDELKTEKFYQKAWGDSEREDRLFKQFEAHCYLVEDLVVELTRAGNFICEMVRKFLISNYRIQEGLLLITSGPHADFSLHTHREEYRPDERGEYPYRGLEKFRTEQRFERSLCFGVRDEADFL
jgi:hypothetical protein